jgi:hypothetical protein
MRQNLSKRLFLNASVWRGLKVEKVGDKVGCVSMICYG